MNDQYQALYQSFRWLVPTQFNIADACCHRWASSSPDARRIAIYYEDESGNREVWTYARLAEAVNQLANGLVKMGVGRGDRVGVVLGQRPETVVAHMAIYTVGGVVLPLSTLFGPEALETRLRDSETRVAIVDHASSANLLAVSDNCPNLQQIIGIGFADERVLPWRSLLARQPSEFKAIPTRSSDPAILLYTSGTTGAPKGALLPHSVLIGNLPGFVASQDWFPKPADVFWSPADWAWTGGMMDALLPTLYFGHPIVGTRGRFSVERAFELLERYQVTNTFLFPTALKMMMKAVPEPRNRYQLALRSIMSAGESVGETVFEWCQSALGVTPNEMFGQTEMNYVVGNSQKRWPARPGSMGRPYPGHQVAVLNDDGQPVAAGETGEIAVNRLDIHGYPDPVMFLGYWRNEAATQAKFKGDWCLTGDLATVDADGYLWYAGRADDVFKSSGYRIGPGEIESCLIGHPAVANAAVVPKPDAERGALVKAYVVLTPEFVHRDRADVIENLQEHVRERLAPYEYPKEIEFVDELPMTTTGKIQRRVLRLREEERARAAAPAPVAAAGPVAAAPVATATVTVDTAHGGPEKQPET
ncbi:AMP-binding protein [Achromobacter marplatensis]|uniref:Acetyl-CoA synthetase n=1 Tax=Achromobacter marplatensis TaxID=470868 RepID=A0ABX9GEX8_9BURK|nr:AMP-binding protein [Achromobacter marplatensis]OWT71259.1 AMP-binding protein [Achromobacter marplatensis]RBP22892.1 acetyl-CoA synthetase [Achromobacter marplatensis]CAB3645517.1 Acetyl-coenzyme A synthetase [Achromobacter marplatensis]